MANVKSISVNITTHNPQLGDSRDGVDLVVGYYSSYGRAPIEATVNLHPRGKYIGPGIDATVDLPDDVAQIHTLEVTEQNYGNDEWRMHEVVSVKMTDAEGTTTEIVANKSMDGALAPQTIYEDDAPGEGVYGLVYDVSGGPHELTVPGGLKPGQMLTISIDPEQQWKLGATYPANCNGPTVAIDEPYWNREVTMQITNKTHTTSYNLVRGCFVLRSKSYTSYYGRSYYRSMIAPIGDYLKVPLLTSPWKMSIELWDNHDNNTGKIGIRYEVHDFEALVQHDSTTPGDATEFNVNPQETYFPSGTYLDTEIDVEVGDMLHLRSDPYETWSLKADGEMVTNANGVFAPISNVTNPKAATIADNRGAKPWWSFSRGCLLGTLDEGKTYFSVGTWLDMRAQQAGRLKLLCFDDSSADNTRSLPVKAWKTTGPWNPDGSGGTSGAKGTFADIEIKTIDPGPSGTGSNKESIVLENTSDDEVDLEGLTLYIPTGQKKGNRKFTFPAGATVAGKQTVVVGVGPKVAGADYSFNSMTPQLWGPGLDEVWLFEQYAAKKD